MNLARPFASLALAALVAATSACATARPEPSQVDLRSRGFTLPSPTKTVGFTQLPRRFENAVVNVTMVVDPQGVPHQIASERRMPEDLSARLMPALSQWRFSPALDPKGNPVSMRVVIPLELVPVD
ncbi:hypothetical protein DB347_04005 [Opitutaceae bacterium EW11]|nr:hypothetical protein DB347_04005 [Opitutaceae bacterium EW11]